MKLKNRFHTPTKLEKLAKDYKRNKVDIELVEIVLNSDIDHELNKSRFIKKILEDEYNSFIFWLKNNMLCQTVETENDLLNLTTFFIPALTSEDEIVFNDFELLKENLVKSNIAHKDSKLFIHKTPLLVESIMGLSCKDIKKLTELLANCLLEETGSEDDLNYFMSKIKTAKNPNELKVSFYIAIHGLDPSIEDVFLTKFEYEEDIDKQIEKWNEIMVGFTGIKFLIPVNYNLLAISYALTLIEMSMIPIAHHLKEDPETIILDKVEVIVDEPTISIFIEQGDIKFYPIIFPSETMIDDVLFYLKAHSKKIILNGVEIKFEYA